MIRKKSRGFSFIEIMAAIGLIGIAIVPLMRLILVGKKGAIDGEKFIMVTNLAREKIEEMKVIPFNNIASDFDNFHMIYKDTSYLEFREADEDPELFYRIFTDVWTQERRRKYESLYQKFITRYRDVYGQEYLIYPDEFDAYRRITLVDEEYSKSNILQKKVNVHLYRKDEEDAPFFSLYNLYTE